MSFNFWCSLAGINTCIVYVNSDYVLNWIALGISLIFIIKLWKSNNKQGEDNNETQ